jgi:hypothetical protein
MSSPRRWVFLLVFLLITVLAACASTGPRPQAQPSPPTTRERGYIPDLFGDREVTYTQMSTAAGPVALIEGDIIVQPTKVPPVSTVVAFRRSLWPGGIVPYSYAPGFTNVASARDAMVLMEAQTPVRFVPRTTQPGFMLFQNHPTANQGAAGVGYNGRQQNILIGMSMTAKGVLHELGHVIGLDHEHNSPVRDQFVEVLIDNVLDANKSDFDIASYAVSALLRPYDFVSIMHYGPTTFGKPLPPPSMGRRTTMRRRDGLPGPLGGAGGDLTPNDIAGIEAMYGPFAFMTHASGGFPLSGKSCLAAGPDPFKYPAFQSKTFGSVFCVDKPTWLWSNIGLKDPRIAGLPPGSYRCLEISEPADPDFSVQPSFLCYPSLTPMILTWSSSGPRSGLKCVLFYAPEAGAAWADDYLCYANGTVGAIGEVIRDASGRCLEIDGSGNAVMTVCGTLRWRRNDVSAGSVASFGYEPKDYGGDYRARCLGTPGTTAKPGDKLVLEPCTGESDQDWLSLGGGTIQNGGYCLQVAASGAVYLNTCTGSSDQMWVIRRTAATPF